MKTLIEMVKNIESYNTAIIVLLSLIVAILTVGLIVYLCFKLID